MSHQRSTVVVIVMWSLVMALAAAACGPKRAAPPPVAAAPAYPTYEKPELAEPMPALAGAVRTHYDEGWAMLQAGRPGDAAAAFAQVVRSTPAFYPAHAARGYALLAGRELDGCRRELRRRARRAAGLSAGARRPSRRAHRGRQAASRRSPRSRRWSSPILSGPRRRPVWRRCASR